VVVAQLVRSPGAYVMEPKDREKQVFIANLLPSRGSWVELEIDKKGLVQVRIHRKRQRPVTALPSSLGHPADHGANPTRPRRWHAIARRGCARPDARPRAPRGEGVDEPRPYRPRLERAGLPWGA